MRLFHWINSLEQQGLPSEVANQFEALIANASHAAEQDALALARACGDLSDTIVPLVSWSLEWIQGSLSRLNANLALNEETHAASPFIEAWRNYFLAASYRRMGKFAEFEDWRDRAVVRSPVECRAFIRDALDVQEAAMLMNKGYFLAAVSRAEHTLNESTDVDAQTLQTAYTTLAVCNESLGNFQAAESYLALERKNARPFDCRFWKTSSENRYLSLYLESERFDLAESLLRRMESENKKTPHSQVYFLQLHLKLLLARGDFERAELKLSELEDQRRIANLDTALHISEERSEILFWQSGVKSEIDAVSKFIRKDLADAFERSDLCAQCVLSISLGKLEILSGALLDAQTHLRQALQLAKEQRYRKLEIGASVALAILAFKRGDSDSMPLYLEHAHILSTELQLRSTEHFTARHLALSRALCEPLTTSTLKTFIETKDDVRNFLLHLSKEKLPKVMVRDHKGFGETLELLCIGDLLKTRNRVLVFAKQGLLVAKGQAQGHEFFEFSPDLALHKLGYLILREGGSVISQERLSKALWRQEFHPEKHGHRLRSAVSKMRELLVPFGISIQFSRNKQGYFISSSKEILFASLIEGVDKEPSQPDRAALLLATIKSFESCTSQQLCQRLKISRQALNRHVTKLLYQGKIKRTGRGPRTKYQVL